MLNRHGYSTYVNSTSSAAERDSQSDEFDLVVTLWKSGLSHETGRASHSVAAIFVLGKNTDSPLVETYQNGIYYFPGRQSDSAKFVRTVKNLLQPFQKQETKARSNGGAVLDRIIGKNRRITDIRNLIKEMSRHARVPILITGETGTGKELVVDALHQSSPRAGKPLIKVNCSAIPATLFESELFGHSRGAFTGAVQNQRGLFERANGGTILLDEIGEMDPKLQPKLLRFLEDYSFHRTGSSQNIKVDVWVLASTNASLIDLIKKGQFRRDLFYRLNALRIELPSLRERTEDIPLLIEELLAREGCAHPIALSGVMDIFLAYDWPGNVRELLNVLKSCTLKNRSGYVMPHQLREELKKNMQKPVEKSSLSLAEVERAHVVKMFRLNDNQIRATARALKVSRNTLRRKLEGYGVVVD
jgi:transcriptional regulator with PAS, ATPase and Fis domain